ncbi:MAG: SPOR domain-containing protein [Deltaproteobacteria bacterium]|nr:SPOR domain-containing protein [Deltaproteobacteria bacterium]
MASYVGGESGNRSRSSSSRQSERTQRREIRLTLGQVSIFWAVIAGSMVAVFLFGLFAGRERGIQLALEGDASVGMRFPVHSNDADRSGASVVAQGKGSQADSGILLASLENAAEGTSSATDDAGGIANAPSDRLNVTGVSPVSEAVQKLEADVGFGQKLASDVVKAGTDATLQATSDGKAIDNRLLNREALNPPQKRPITTQLNAEAKKIELAAEKSKETFSSISIKDAPRARLGDIKSSSPLTSVPPKNVEKSNLVVKKEVRKEPTSRAVQSTKALSNKPLASGWYVQVAAKTSDAEAMGLSKRVGNLGLSTTVEQATVKGTRYYRVLVGPFKSREGAQSAERKIKSSRVVDNMPFLKRVS